jgi:hypothetical protein
MTQMLQTPTEVIVGQRQFDVGLISDFGPREARPKVRKFVPRAKRTERIFALVEFTLDNVIVNKMLDSVSFLKGKTFRTSPRVE